MIFSLFSCPPYSADCAQPQVQTQDGWGYLVHCNAHCCYLAWRKSERDPVVFRWFCWDRESRPYNELAKAEYRKAVGRDYADSEEQKEMEDFECRALIGGAARIMSW